MLNFKALIILLLLAAVYPVWILITEFQELGFERRAYAISICFGPGDCNTRALVDDRFKSEEACQKGIKFMSGSGFEKKNPKCVPCALDYRFWKPYHERTVCEI